MSQIGLILLMFQIGLDFDFSHLKEKENSRTVARVAALGLVVPFLLGLAAGYLSHDALAPEVNLLGYSLFLANSNTRAWMELVVINVGYDLGVIPASVFTMLVIMAVVSTLVTAPALRLWLPRLKLKPVLEAS